MKHQIKLFIPCAGPVPVGAGLCRLVPVCAGPVPVGAGWCRLVPVGAGAGADRCRPVGTGRFPRKDRKKRCILRKMKNRFFRKIDFFAHSCSLKFYYYQL